MSPRPPGGNLWRLLAYRFLAECFFIMPVLVPLFRSRGLSITQIMIVESVFHVVSLAWEIPSGYFADVLGRRESLLVGALLIAAGLGVYARSASFAGFCLAETICGLGFAFKSGADSALLYDTLAAAGREDDYQAREGRLQAVARLGTAVGSIAGGLLGLVTLRLPFVVNIGTGLVMALAAVGLVEPPRRRPSAAHPLRAIVRVAGACLGDPALRRLMALQALLQSTGVVGIWSYFLYYPRAGLSVAGAGAAFAAFQLASALGGLCTARARARLGADGVLRLGLAIGLVFLALARFTSAALLPLILAAGLLWNLVTPILYEGVNLRTESSVRATVLSVMSMFGSLAYVVLAPSFGRVVDRGSLAAGHLLLAVLVLGVGGALVVAVGVAGDLRADQRSRASTVDSR